MMREIKDTVAEDCLPQLLVLVEQGEAIAIIRDGKAVAHLVPAGSEEGLPEEDVETRKRRKAAAENFIQWREQQTPLSPALQEILDWRRHGLR